jgi:hypothetical protein
VVLDPAELSDALAALGWTADVRPVAERFIAGTAEPAR